MLRNKRFIILLFLVGFLVFGGCGPKKDDVETGGIDSGVEKTPSDIKKAKLLGELDRKYENPQAHYELGQLYQSDGLWSKAEHHYNTALTFEPAHRDAQAAIVKVLMAAGDMNKAQLTADIYIDRVSASAGESLRLALGFQKQGLDDYAMICYQQALRLAPNSAKINRQIGYYYLSKGNTTLAKEYLMRSFQLNPNQPEVAGELGRLGVEVRIPRKKTKDVKKLDSMVDETDQSLQP